VGLPETFAQEASSPRGELLLDRPSEEVAPTGADLQVEDTLVAGLGRRSTVLLFDSFRPAPAVERWLFDELIADIRAAVAPIVIVVAGRSPLVGKALPAADVVLDAQPPTEEELREFFRALGEHLQPAAGAAEVDVLAADGASKPHLIRSLVRALSYARADA
jgi:hypothetical protein